MLLVSTSGYFSLNKRPAKAEDSERMVAVVKAAHQKTRGTYGAERLHLYSDPRRLVVPCRNKRFVHKEIVGFSLSPRMDTTFVADALHKAFHTHQPLPRLILHSDRSSQYCCQAYQERIEKYHMVCSMSRKGDCYDNAPMESFWGLLKTELVHRRRYATHAEASVDITEYIEIFYNRQRRQAALGYLLPAAFVQKL